MDRYNVLVLMEKDKETGFFVQTVDSYQINSTIELIENAYMNEEDGSYYVYLTLTTTDVSDYQYYGIYDLYDEDIFKDYPVELLDGSGEYNPRWIIKLPYNEDRPAMESLINSLLETHEAELERILPLVEADKEKYMAEIETEE